MDRKLKKWFQPEIPQEPDDCEWYWRSRVLPAHVARKLYARTRPFCDEADHDRVRFNSDRRYIIWVTYNLDRWIASIGVTRETETDAERTEYIRRLKEKADSVSRDINGIPVKPTLRRGPRIKK